MYLAAVFFGDGYQMAHVSSYFSNITKSLPKAEDDDWSHIMVRVIAPAFQLGNCH